MVEKQTEKQLEYLIRQALELHGWVVLKTDAGAAKRATYGLSRRGGDIPLGWPDLTALHPKRPPVLIEVKRPRGRLRPSQAYRVQALLEAGYRVYVVDSLDTLAAMLREVEPMASRALTGG